MYEDLRKYIIDKKILEGTEAWYVKRLCECSNDEKLVATFIENLKKNGNQLDPEFGPFECMLEYSYHWDDVFEEEYIFMKLLLSCFIQRTRIFELTTDPFDLFLNYTTRGKKIMGNEERYPINHVLDNWKDFLDIFADYSDEDIKQNYNDPAFQEEVCDDMCFTWINLMFDEKEETCELEQILDDICFSKAGPGQYFYGTMTYSGNFTEYDSISKETLEYIDSCICKKRDLSDFDNEFSRFMPQVNLYFDNLYEMKGSEREVIF